FTIANVNAVLVDDDRVRQVELAGTRSLHSPSQQAAAVFVELQNTGIAVSVGDVDVPIPIPRHIGRLIEMAHVIAGQSHTAESQQHAPLGAELQDDVRADVGRPDVVVCIDSNHVRGYEEIVRDAPQQASRRVEFHQRVLTAVEEINVALRVDRDPARLDEVLPWRQLKETRDDFVIELRTLRLESGLCRSGRRPPRGYQETETDDDARAPIQTHDGHLAPGDIQVRRMGDSMSAAHDGAGGAHF